MSYKIIEVHIEYKENKPEMIAVMWESNPKGWVRATYMTTKQCAGYGFIAANEVLSPALIQETAGYGMNLPKELKQKFFPGKKSWEHYE